jgi:hypothetical protein
VPDARSELRDALAQRLGEVAYKFDTDHNDEEWQECLWLADAALAIIDARRAVAEPRLTVVMTSNPQMDGRHYRDLQWLDEEGRRVSLTVARIGKQSDAEAERLQTALDELAARQPTIGRAS